MTYDNGPTVPAQPSTNPYIQQPAQPQPLRNLDAYLGAALVFGRVCHP